ncbi:hypothetical protein GN958_ATG04692 [Phytophthora infestans]|uniref:RxLR effector PexRD54 WY domain-containing protein n=1 Tax=Phytophthora infestans TaxID=4787 RepID=A0A8S9V6H5_PHYIN|nr:hypothetical protein GN958_ATG04692 [Phytophthora infestans]
MNKTSLRTFLNCFVLLSILVLLEPVGGGPVSTTVSNRSVLSNETSNGAVNADINRMQTWSAKDDEYDTSEERVDIKVPGAEKLKGIITSGTTKLETFASRVKNRLAFNNQKGTEDSVANLGVGAMESKVPADKELGLLKHPALQTFISYATKHHTVDPYEFLVLKLAKRHGEDELPKMLVKAKSDSDLVSMAVKLESTQFKIWKEKGKTSDDVFKMLRLDTDQSIDILKSPGLVSWFSYVKKISENPTEVLYRKLEIRFSDAEILKTFFAGKKDGTLKFSLGPMVRLIEGNWLGQKKTAEDVFTHLSLDKDGINFFENPILVTWFTYVKSMHKEEADNVMSSVMTKYYDDETLKKMVTHSSITGNLKATAAQVASALWLREGMSAHEAFKVLRLRGKGDNALLDPAFGTWVSYFNKLQRKKMNQDEYAIIAELSKHFDNDLDLARALCAVANKNPDLDTAQTITSLQNLQFKQWIQKKQWNAKDLRYADLKYTGVYLSFYRFSHTTREK